ncbi:hypothetical protein Syun_010886 [Stephania yunnanensis]|uniref:MAT1 centre domain-containing protein n=1 Tax=Stephania yunnanensis TaxID=152371 RepID=A0AAP0JWI3_9MAGN
MVVGAGTNNSYAKEIAIRRRIGNIFNKREEDFPSLREYNDYLEEVEDMNNECPCARKAEELAAALAASKGVPAQTEATDGVRIQSYIDVAIGVSQSYQAGVGAQGQYAPAMTGGAIGQPRPLGMAPQPVPIGGGPDMQDYVDDEEMMKLKAERGASAGGWTMELSKRRALEEAFGSIWI